MRRRRADAATIISLIFLFDCHVLRNSSFENCMNKKFSFFSIISLLEIDLTNLLLILYASRSWSLCVRWINVSCSWFSFFITSFFFFLFILSKKVIHVWSLYNLHHIDSVRSSRRVFIFRAKICWIQSYLFLIKLWAYYASWNVRYVFSNDDDSFSKLIRDIKLFPFFLVIFCFKSFVTNREWNSFAISFRDANVSIMIKKNCMFFLSFC